MRHGNLLSARYCGGDASIVNAGDEPRRARDARAPGAHGQDGTLETPCRYPDKPLDTHGEAGYRAVWGNALLSEDAMRKLNNALRSRSVAKRVGDA